MELEKPPKKNSSSDSPQKVFVGQGRLRAKLGHLLTHRADPSRSPIKHQSPIHPRTLQLQQLHRVQQAGHVRRQKNSYKHQNFKIKQQPVRKAAGLPLLENNFEAGIFEGQGLRRFSLDRRHWRGDLNKLWPSIERPGLKIIYMLRGAPMKKPTFPSNWQIVFLGPKGL